MGNQPQRAHCRFRIGSAAIPGILFSTGSSGNPLIGFYSAVILGFVLMGIGRYVPSDLQIGIALDSILFLTYVALFFNRFYEKIDWSPAKRDVTLLAAIWFGFSLLQFFNPEVQSRTAWLAGVRGISLYMMMIIPLVLLFIDNMRKVDIFLSIWGTMSILASLKGIMQIVIGPDPFEQIWLNSDAGLTHIIFGNLQGLLFHE